MTAPATTPHSLDLQVDVETPEQVALSYTIAGVGSRAAAALVDGAICVAAYGLLAWLVSLAVRAGGGSVQDTARSAWGITVLVLGQFAIFWGYYVLWEGLRDGQTPGKRAFGLRVVRDGGHAVDFAASAIRNLVRVLDLQPGFFYGVGAISVAASPLGKRVGDYVAGTMVVRERALPVRPRETAAVASGDESSSPLATLLTDDEYALLARFGERRADLEPARAVALRGQLAARFRPRATDADLLALADAPFLARLLEHERRARARGVAARSETGAGRAQHAIVAEGGERWAAFATRLADAQRRGLARLTEEELSDFVARYRELTTDLARLRTASRGRDSDAVYALSRLVAGGHNLLYRGRRVRGATLGRYVAFGIPAELRRSWRPIALAALLLFAPAVAAFEAVRRSPVAAQRLVSPGMVDRAETGVERDRTGGGYLPEEMMRARGSVLTSLIATNNVRVTYTVFAGGATAGVLTVFQLVFNGVAALGAPLGYYARLGILHQILGFVAPHGVIELAAICIAGGAGFHVACGLLLPGALSRREALVQRGRRALTLVAGATLLLVVSGVIEGYVSPLVWPLRDKLLVSAVTAVALVGYWCLGWRPLARSPGAAPAVPGAVAA